MKRVYEYPLIDWISATLHDNSLESVLKTVKNGESLDELLKSKADNSRYIEKILREEITNQFSDLRRPMLEIILNSVDAKPSGYKGSYGVSINVRRKKFSSSDFGRGMSLKDVLMFLIIPFNTEKKGVEEIGRFGVGFLSTLNYCIAEPNKTRLVVETRNGEEGYTIEFYATNSSIDDLMMRISPTGRSPSGTKVTIRRKIGKKSIIEYLVEHLENIPSYVSRIMVNNKQVNDDSKFKWYVQPVNLNILGREVEQQVGFRASNLDFSPKILLTSQGVLVRSFRDVYKNISATVSFPPAVQVVEGRDEFKMDDNYRTCVNAAFKAFEDYLKEQEKDEELIKYVTEPVPNAEKRLTVAKKMFVKYMTSFVPSLMSALGVTDISQIQNINSIREELFPGKKYALTEADVQDLKPFFKEFVEKQAFEVLYCQSLSYWKSFYKTKQGLLEDLLKPVQTFSTQEFVEKVKDDKSFYPNLHLIAWLLKQQDMCKQVSLVELPAGDNCFFIDDNNPSYPLYINISQPYVQGGLNHSKVYSLTSDYFTLKEARRIHHITKLDDIEEQIGLLNQYLNNAPKQENEQ